MIKFIKEYWVLIAIPLTLAFFVWCFFMRPEPATIKTKFCKVRIITDSTYTGSDDCWVVEECGDGESFESLFHGEETKDCVEFQNEM